MTYIGITFLSIGVLFLILGALGILRFPDLFNRMQAGTKATTFGAIFTIMGVGFLEPLWLPKSFIIVLFILISNPISSHALARSAYKKESKLWKNTVVDQYADSLKDTKEEK
jgi:multicomponent Na+:H+ antiporter subunit G